MKRIKSALFSMLTSSCLVVIFGVAIAYATFLENDYGTQTAKILVYNALWFNILLGVTAVNLVGGLFYYKAFQLRRWSMVLFHLAFIVILIGAGITRFYSYEGMMHIREGQDSNQLISTNTFIQVEASTEAATSRDDWEVMFSPYTGNQFDKSLELGGNELEIEVLDYVSSALESVVADEGGSPMLSFVLVNRNASRDDVVLELNEEITRNNFRVSFEGKNTNSSIYLRRSADSLLLKAQDSIQVVAMNGNVEQTVAPGDEISLKSQGMYQLGNHIFALKAYYPFARKVLSRVTGAAAAQASDAIMVDLKLNSQQKQVAVFKNSGEQAKTAQTRLGDVDVKLSFGPKLIELPFKIFLNDFQLERYPGSMSPSSYASEVTLIDRRNQLEMPYRIFMNNILDYDGFRFFQSSYDTDEKGTVLSVSYDYLGTGVTYVGYFLMTLGMLATFFNKKSRFQSLLRSSVRLKNLKKKSFFGFLLAVLMVSPAIVNAQNGNMVKIDKDHLKQFETLLVQDTKGRVEPVNTLASEVLRKLNKKNTFEGLSASEVFLGMSSRPAAWRNVPIIRISNGELRKRLGFRDEYVTFNQMLDPNTGVYKLQQLVDETYQKQPTQRNKYDKEIINVDERMNICYQIFQGDFLKVFPIQNDENNKWVGEKEFYKKTASEGGEERLLTDYFQAVNEAISRGSFGMADQKLNALKDFQQTHGNEIIPSQAKINWEIRYNNWNIFGWLSKICGVVGFLLLITHLLGIFNEKLKLKRILSAGTWLVAVVFAAYTAGLALLWYIAGHAPWSNGYETMLYIGWASLLTGFVFLKRSHITLAVTTILASLILMVAGMSWMNPEITNLVPVLKSYWLIVHVAVITASYGFLGVAALVGFLNLIIMTLRKPGNLKNTSFTIVELAIIIELSMIVGLILLTVGAFIGGVWANESWGRYWGWDPKETWALVTILVYSFIIHLRKVPGMYNHFVLSALALAGFSSVLMTFFGVNYYLSGMHSYAQGDAPAIPSFVYVAVAVVFIAIFLAARSENKYGDAEKVVKLEAKDE
ncbi:cytochrome c biogenesis protein CcsA [Sunxiuqinia sp. sy24]|uniref:cytochrome c biogenesis protein CcsA n=1 Tax=Sunxiuqinia sp. sy24 TaxID=3461495 RepID=UPI0040462237